MIIIIIIIIMMMMIIIIINCCTILRKAFLVCMFSNIERDYCSYSECTDAIEICVSSSKLITLCFRISLFWGVSCSNVHIYALSDDNANLLCILLLALSYNNVFSLYSIAGVIIL